MRGLTLLPLCVLIAGCASSSSEIKSSYVAISELVVPAARAEAERVSRRASEAAGVQDTHRTSDAWVTGAAIVLFWPAAFFVKGDGQNAAELGTAERRVRSD